MHTNVHVQTQIQSPHKADTLEKTKEATYKLHNGCPPPSHSHSTYSHPGNPNHTQMHTASCPCTIRNHEDNTHFQLCCTSHTKAPSTDWVVAGGGV